MSCIVSDLTNKRFGKLLVLSQNGRDKWGQVIWRCKCDCGRERLIVGGNLRRVKGDNSCGCSKPDRLRTQFTIHNKSRSPEYIKYRSHVKRFHKYGLTETDFKKLLIKQDNRCAICGVVPDSKTSRSQDGFHIDHSHVSGRVRGLLCGKCNTGIGMLKESEEILLSAIKYLQNNK